MDGYSTIENIQAEELVKGEKLRLGYQWKLVNLSEYIIITCEPLPAFSFASFRSDGQSRLD